MVKVYVVYSKYPPNGLDGYYYLLIFKDNFSKYVWSFLLENSIQNKIFKDWLIELLKTIPNLTITSIYTDYGS